MSEDMKAKEITLKYEGGSVTMSRGNAEDIFGKDSDILCLKPESKTVSVKGHTRVPTIGGDSTSVSAYSYTFESWPRGTASNAAAGTVILMEWDGSDGDFTGRVSGPMWRAAKFFDANTTKILGFRTERGSTYGPFGTNCEDEE
mgnify:FL=1|tara:strand:- start:229 stop:660 length:432 start_codon:yes stop_codon:yes gene_type:complete